MNPTMILLAGPNGAGKSTLYKTRVAPHFSGPFINADVIQKDELLTHSPEHAYRAAKIADLRRAEMLEKRLDFATETVFSHPSKLELIRDARKIGFTVIVMHVGVDTADLSVARVTARVAEGGHDVPEDKIRSRYIRNGALIRNAIHEADRGIVYDNSSLNNPPKQCLLFIRGQLVSTSGSVPAWVKNTYADDLPP